MVKQQGSLGFTLRKEDESVLGHYVRALVREPATTDGRIKPGDKILAVSNCNLYFRFFSPFLFFTLLLNTIYINIYVPKKNKGTQKKERERKNTKSFFIC